MGTIIDALSQQNNQVTSQGGAAGLGDAINHGYEIGARLNEIRVKKEMLGMELERNKSMFLDHANNALEKAYGAYSSGQDGYPLLRVWNQLIQKGGQHGMPDDDSPDGLKNMGKALKSEPDGFQEWQRIKADSTPVIGSKDVNKMQEHANKVQAYTRNFPISSRYLSKDISDITKNLNDGVAQTMGQSGAANQTSGIKERIAQADKMHDIMVTNGKDPQSFVGPDSY